MQRTLREDVQLTRQQIQSFSPNGGLALTRRSKQRFRSISSLKLHRTRE